MRLILRGLIKTPLFTTAAIISLALGIGANTAIFSLIDQMLLRTLPVQRPEELAYIYAPGPWNGSMSTDEGGGPSFSYPLLREMQGEVLKPGSSFTGLAGSREQAVSLTYNNNSQLGRSKLVTGNYFPLLGVRPALGRLLTEDDDRTEGAHPVAVLSAHYWILRFGADPGVLNQKLTINGYPFTIVGVAEKGFRGERLGEPPDVYYPMAMKKDTTPDWNAYTDRRNAWITLLVRRKPGVTLAQAEAEINLPYRAQVEKDIQLLKGNTKMVERYRVRKMTLKRGEYGRGGLREQAMKPLLMLIGVTAMVLLIACANVANLQLARSAARTREVSIRLAIGASRRQLIRQLLAESCVLSLAGGALGLLIAFGTLKGIISVLPGRGMTSFLSASPDPRLLLFAFALSVATGLAFGLFPALHASRPDLVTSLKDQAGQVSSTGSANLFRKVLVTAQVAVALLLLISGGLFARTMVNLTRIDLGIKADNLMTFSVLPKLNMYTDQQTAAFHDQLLEKLTAIAGVTLASTSQVPAIAGSNSSNSITVAGYVPQGFGDANSRYNAIGPGYFRTMGVPLVEGREFTDADTSGSPKVVIVNEAFVRKFFKGRNALGQRMSTDDGKKESDLDLEIAGIVKDSKYSEMREPPPTVYYIPMKQLPRWAQLYYYVRTSVDPAVIGPAIQRAVTSIDPNLPIRDLKTMQRQIDENLIQERLVSMLTAAFAGLATLLAAIGLYGVLAFNIARRTREIGIRIALGAAAGNVRGLVAREVLLMLLIGTVIGVGGAAAGGKLVQSLLFEMKPWDALVYTAAVVAMWLVAVAAAMVPTRRAMRVDPMVALRYE